MRSSDGHRRTTRSVVGDITSPLGQGTLLARQ